MILTQTRMFTWYIFQVVKHHVYLFSITCISSGLTSCLHIQYTCTQSKSAVQKISFLLGHAVAYLSYVQD